MRAADTSTATTSSAPTERPSQHAAGHEGDRFQTLYRESAPIFRRAGDDYQGPAPQDADDANRILALDDSSPVRFADVQDLGDDRGRFCLVSHEGTFVALDIGRAVTVLLGDGSCTYDAHDAAVVGDVFGGGWTKGGHLMGHLTVRRLFADKLGVEGDPTAPPPVDPTAAPPSSSPLVPAEDEADPQLLGEARTLAFAIDGYALSEGHYPMVDPADLVPTVAGALTVRLGPHTRVHSYRATATGYTMCVADDSGWVRWDGTRRGADVSTGATDDGTYTSSAELDRMCATPSTP